MKKQMIYEPSKAVPTANIAVNKSRIKVYNKKGETPTYYLQSGQEFQIEIFNPTTDVVLVKISLNNTPISQGGLVLNPGQRVFLDRYLDVAKKFKFETYEVANTKEIKKAIENNGDVKVEFYRERKLQNYDLFLTSKRTVMGGPFGYPTCLNTNGSYEQPTFTTLPLYNSVYFTSSVDSADYNTRSEIIGSLSLGDVTVSSTPIKKEFKSKSVLRSAKTIETGRVEQGSNSDQKFKTVSKDFEYFAFHMVEYKLLPVSQKINTVEDLNVKVYCTNCGAKLGKGHKYCSSCGTKA